MVYILKDFFFFGGGGMVVINSLKLPYLFQILFIIVIIYLFILQIYYMEKEKNGYNILVVFSSSLVISCACNSAAF